MLSNMDFSKCISPLSFTLVIIWVAIWEDFNFLYSFFFFFLIHWRNVRWWWVLVKKSASGFQNVQLKWSWVGAVTSSCRSRGRAWWILTQLLSSGRCLPPLWSAFRHQGSAAYCRGTQLWRHRGEGSSSCKEGQWGARGIHASVWMAVPFLPRRERHSVICG